MKPFQNSVLILTLCTSFFINAQDTSDVRPDSVQEIVNYDHVYVNHIKTVRLSTRNAKHGYPIISTSSASQLELIFDDLKNDYTEYRYEIIHCDREWNALDEDENLYLERYSSGLLENIEFSSATKIGYSQYKLLIPEKGDRFRRSGNYMLHVLKESSDSVVLSRRFSVIEGLINVNANVVRTEDTKYRSYMQQIKFELYDPRQVIQDVSALYVVILKNRSWEISCDKLKPSFVSGNKITYNNTSSCYFDGGNEYRDFNMIEYKNISNNVIKVNMGMGKGTTLWLDDDIPRSFLQYSSQTDYNGRVKYTGDLKEFNDIELDYAKVNFTLNTEEPMLGYEIYLFGEMSDFQLDTTFKLNFNFEKGKYEKELLLKQGYYNYQYVVKSPYKDGPDETLIEGSHFDTENDYTLYVYYHSHLEGYDQLIGTERINSRTKIDQTYQEE